MNDVEAMAEEASLRRSEHGAFTVNAEIGTWFPDRDRDGRWTALHIDGVKITSSLPLAVAVRRADVHFQEAP